jgi:hypothetical protein
MAAPYSDVAVAGFVVKLIGMNHSTHAPGNGTTAAQPVAHGTDRLHTDLDDAG